MQEIPLKPNNPDPGTHHREQLTHCPLLENSGHSLSVVNLDEMKTYKSYLTTATCNPFFLAISIMDFVPRLFPSQKAIKASETSAISSFLMGPAALPYLSQSAGYSK